MIITRDEILNEVKFPNGLDEFQVNPHSIDLRIEDNIVLLPGILTLVKTADIVGLPNNIMGVVFPRSSTNRRMITCNITGVVDAGYEGNLILPLKNETLQPITLLRGERVASIIFYRLEKPVTVRLSKYHNGGSEYKPDKSAEANLLATGSVEEIKTKYKI